MVDFKEHISLDEIVAAFDTLADELLSQDEPEIAGYNAVYWRNSGRLIQAGHPLPDDFFLMELIDALDSLFSIMKSDRTPLLAGHKPDFWLDAAMYLVDSIPHLGLARAEAVIMLRQLFQRLTTDWDLVEMCPPVEIHLHGPLLTPAPRVDRIGLIYICQEAMELFNRDLDDWFEELITEGLWIQLDTVVSLQQWFDWQGSVPTRLIWAPGLNWQATLAELERTGRTTG